MALKLQNNAISHHAQLGYLLLFIYLFIAYKNKTPGSKIEYFRRGLETSHTLTEVCHSLRNLNFKFGAWRPGLSHQSFYFKVNCQFYKMKTRCSNCFGELLQSVV